METRPERAAMELHIETTDANGTEKHEEIAYLDLDTEDWALVIDGLVAVGGNPNRATGRQEQAWKLVDVICEGLGVSATDMVYGGVCDTADRDRTE
jgi:hypothetical protein